MSTDQTVDGQTAGPAAPAEDVEVPAQPDGDLQQQPEESQTFGREYVQKLRDEAAGHRVRAKRADALAAALTAAQAAATGRLADPTDLPHTDELLDDDGMPDPAKVDAAIGELLARKPHLAARRPTGDVGQGARAEPDGFSLAGLLRHGA